MATLDLKQYRYNDFLNKVESTVKTVDAVPNRDRNFNCINCEPQRHINVGDLIHIGNVPMKSVITDIRVIYEEAFPADTIFNIGFLDDNLDLIEMATDIVADSGEYSQYIPIGNAGSRAPDGTAVPEAERDYRGSIWNGATKPLTMAILMRSNSEATGAPVKVGKMKILISFIRYGEEDYIRGDRIAYPLDYID